MGVNNFFGGRVDIVDGTQVYYDVSGNVMFTIDPINRLVNFPSGSKLGLPASYMRTGHKDIPLTDWREIATNATINATGNGGLLASDTTPVYGRVNGATDKQTRLAWAAANVDEIQAHLVLPTDLDDTLPIIVNLLVAKDANMDATANIAVGYFEGVGDTNAGGNTAAITETTPTLKQVTIAASDVGVAPQPVTLTLIPGTHANDVIYLYGSWIEYTKKTS